MAINQIEKTAIGRRQVDNSTAAMIKYRNNTISKYETILITQIGRVHSKFQVKQKGSSPANPERVGPVKQIYLSYCMGVLPRLQVFSLQEGSAL